MSPPSDGILVLDLSRVLAGPFCTMLLADLGARVIKVEHPEAGDVTRGWGPPYHAGSGLSAYYLSVNRNKESIALDLASAEGARAVRDPRRAAPTSSSRTSPPAALDAARPLARRASPRATRGS